VPVLLYRQTVTPASIASLPSMSPSPSASSQTVPLIACAVTGGV